MDIKFLKSKNVTKIKTKKQLIVVHWAACTGPQCVNWFLSPGCHTSAHYVIDRHGNITQLVDEKYIAWHAGYSSLGDYPNDLKRSKKPWNSINVCSVGIELSGPPTAINKIIKKRGWNLKLWTDWPEDEINALIGLCIDIAGRWPGIRLTDHSTIAPGRKSDVKKGRGIDLFPWERLISETEIIEA